MTKAQIKPLGIGIAGGLLGVALGLGIWHAWNDHVAVHQIIQLINQANTKPVPPVVP